MIISKVIKEKGFTIEEVATKMGIARITLARTIGNNPTIGTLRKIAEAIECDVTDFFADEVAATKNNDLIALVNLGNRTYEVSSIQELEEVV